MKIWRFFPLLVLALTVVSPNVFSDCSESMGVGSMVSVNQNSMRIGAANTHRYSDQSHAAVQGMDNNLTESKSTSIVAAIPTSVPDMFVGSMGGDESMQKQMQNCCIYNCKTCNMSVCSAVAMVHSFDMISNNASVVAIGFLQEFFPAPSLKTLLRPPIFS